MADWECRTDIISNDPRFYEITNCQSGMTYAAPGPPNEPLGSCSNPEEPGCYEVSTAAASAGSGGAAASYDGTSHAPTFGVGKSKLVSEIFAQFDQDGIKHRCKLFAVLGSDGKTVLGFGLELPLNETITEPLKKVSVISGDGLETKVEHGSICYRVNMIQ